jgi:hypothetical protein
MACNDRDGIFISMDGDEQMNNYIPWILWPIGSLIFLIGFRIAWLRDWFHWRRNTLPHDRDQSWVVPVSLCWPIAIVITIIALIIKSLWKASMIIAVDIPPELDMNDPETMEAMSEVEAMLGNSQRD